MDEPNLRDISDYNSLEGEKRKVVIAVILACLVMGAIYTVAYNTYDNVDDGIKVEKSLNNIPMK